MKKVALLTVLTLVFALTAGVMAAGHYEDGTYSGSAEGFGGEVTAEVTIEGGEIASVDVTGDDETPDFWEDAVQTADDIVAAGSTDVDTETGATASSDAIVAAVDAALAGAEAEEPEEEVDEDVDEEEEYLPETGGGIVPMLPGIGGLIAAGGALLLAKKRK